MMINLPGMAPLFKPAAPETVEKRAGDVILFYMQNIWTENFAPRHSEVDRAGRVKLRSVFDYLQEAAANHATDLGCGIGFLSASGKMWVLSRIAIELSRPLRLGDRLALKTYPTGFSRLFADRQFDMADESGARVLAGSSCWLLLDAAALRPLRPDRNLAESLPDNAGLPVFFPAPGKLVTPNDCRPVFRTGVVDSQIDVNGHMNNSEYAGMVHNALAGLLGRTPAVRTLQINFNQASRLNEAIELFGVVHDGGTFFIEGRDDAGNSKFQAAGSLFTDQN